jgi:hypothetical protein
MFTVSLRIVVVRVDHDSRHRTRVSQREVYGIDEPGARDLGREQPAAVVAIETCREAWREHDLLTSWNNRVVLIDTMRSKRGATFACLRQTKALRASASGRNVFDFVWRQRASARKVGSALRLARAATRFGTNSHSRRRSEDRFLERLRHRPVL